MLRDETLRRVPLFEIILGLGEGPREISKRFCSHINHPICSRTFSPQPAHPILADTLVSHIHASNSAQLKQVPLIMTLKGLSSLALLGLGCVLPCHLHISLLTFLPQRELRLSHSSIWISLHLHGHLCFLQHSHHL